MPREPQPVYSHGGSGIIGWPAVPGTGVSAGNPIEVFRATSLNWPRIQLTYYNTPNMTIVTEINPGPADASTGVPDPNHWLDISNGGDVVVAASAKSYSVPPDSMYVRTRITAYVSGTLESMVPSIELPTGQKVMAQYPTVKKGAAA